LIELVIHVCACVCVCVHERESERERLGYCSIVAPVVLIFFFQGEIKESLKTLN